MKTNITIIKLVKRYPTKITLNFHCDSHHLILNINRLCIYFKKLLKNVKFVACMKIVILNLNFHC